MRSPHKVCWIETCTSLPLPKNKTKQNKQSRKRAILGSWVPQPSQWLPFVSLSVVQGVWGAIGGTQSGPAGSLSCSVQDAPGTSRRCRGIRGTGGSVWGRMGPPRVLFPSPPHCPDLAGEAWVLGAAKVRIPGALGRKRKKERSQRVRFPKKVPFPALHPCLFCISYLLKGTLIISVCCSSE